MRDARTSSLAIAAASLCWTASPVLASPGLYDFTNVFTAPYDVQPYVRLNNTGTVAFSATSQSGFRTIFAGSGGAPQEVLQQTGRPTDPFGLTVPGYFDLNDAGQVAAFLYHGEQRDNASDDWNELLIGTPGTMLSYGEVDLDVSWPSLNNSGNVAYVGYGDGSGPGRVHLQSGSSRTTLNGFVAEPDNSGPSGYKPLFLTDGGHVLFSSDAPSGDYASDGTSTVRMTWENSAGTQRNFNWSYRRDFSSNGTYIGGTATEITQRTPLDNLGRYSSQDTAVTAASIRARKVNNLGDVAFVGSTTSSLDASNNIFVTSGSNLNRIVSVGDALFGSTLTELSSWDHALDVNDAGSVAFSYTLADGREGIARADLAQPPTPLQNLVIVTHGWQRGGQLIGLPEVVSAVEQRLVAEGVDAVTEVVPFEWEEAVTPGSNLAVLQEYRQARAATAMAGQRLAEQIQQFVRDGRAVQPGYNPNIHVIGHSLGTMVNAEAVGQLIGVDVEQVTILDSPLAPAAELAMRPADPFSHAPYFYEKMGFGSVEYVENFYGGELLSANFVFGQRIPGAGPGDGGLFLEDADHLEVPNEFYRALVAGDNSVLGSDEYMMDGLQWNSPLLPDWTSGDIWNPIQTREKRLDVITPVGGDELIPVFGNVTILDDGTANLQTASPAIVASGLVTLPDDFSYFEFLADPISGDGLLTLSFDGETLWYGDFDMIGDDDLILMPLADLAGLTGSFEWRLDPLGDDPAVLNVSGVGFSRLVSVPEPSVAVCLSGVLLLSLRRVRSAR